MASLRARLVYDVLMPLLRSKHRYDATMSADTLRATARAPAAAPKQSATVRIGREQCRGHALYRLSPPTGEPRHRLFYLHGGAFVNPITRYHWKLLTWLVARLRAEIVVPMYPLAPRVSIENMVPVIEDIHEQVTAGGCYGLIGDSAGAYLTLALARRLRQRDRLRAPSMVLISPCLDLALGDPCSQAIDARDPMLDLASMHRVLRLAAAPRAPDDAALNLLREGLDGLPAMLALAGSRDIVYPDTGHLAAAVRAAGGDIEVLEGPGMAHVWPLLPVPEARAARQAIAAFIERHGDSLTAAG